METVSSEVKFINDLRYIIQSLMLGLSRQIRLEKTFSNKFI